MIANSVVLFHPLFLPAHSGTGHIIFSHYALNVAIPPQLYSPTIRAIVIGGYYGHSAGQPTLLICFVEALSNLALGFTGNATHGSDIRQKVYTRECRCVIIDQIDTPQLLATAWYKYLFVWPPPQRRLLPSPITADYCAICRGIFTPAAIDDQRLTAYCSGISASVPQ